MGNVELLIKLDKDTYDALMHENFMHLLIKPQAIADEMAKSIRHGTLLPKGHSDLKDELDLDLFSPSLGTEEHVNNLMAKHNIDYVNGDDEDKVRAFALDLISSCMNVIETAPTIIEANKGE